MRIVLKRRTVNCYICAIAGILSMNPYFVWPTFMNGIFAYFVYIIYAIAIFVMFKNSSRIIKGGNVLGVVLLIFIFILTYLHTYNGINARTSIGGMLLFSYLGMFCCIQNDFKKDIFEIFVKLFIISLIPGLVYYVLELVGISLQIGTIYSQNQIQYVGSYEHQFAQTVDYYKLYVGGVVRVTYNMRFSGMYDEAGLVGTVAVLCLAGYRFDIKENRYARWLMLFALITFSLAAYILILLYYIVWLLKNGKWKLLLFLIATIVGINVLLAIETDNQLITTLQNRIQVVDGMLYIVNNRETSAFELGFSAFQQGGLVDKAFGFGRESSSHNTYMVGSSSYKNFVYEFGYVGFGLMIINILYWYRCYYVKMWRKHWSQIVLLILFVISIYQRPAVYYPYYFIILYGGAAMLEKQNYREKEYVNCASN